MSRLRQGAEITESGTTTQFIVEFIESMDKDPPQGRYAVWPLILPSQTNKSSAALNQPRGLVTGKSPVLGKGDREKEAGEETISQLLLAPGSCPEGRN